MTVQEKIESVEEFIADANEFLNSVHCKNSETRRRHTTLAIVEANLQLNKLIAEQEGVK